MGCVTTVAPTTAIPLAIKFSLIVSFLRQATKSRHERTRPEKIQAILTSSTRKDKIQKLPDRVVVVVVVVGGGGGGGCCCNKERS